MCFRPYAPPAHWRKEDLVREMIAGVGVHTGQGWDKVEREKPNISEFRVKYSFGGRRGWDKVERWRCFCWA